MPGTSGSRIVADVDFTRNGRHQGFLRLFHSVHSSAYGFIPIELSPAEEHGVHGINERLPIKELGNGIHRMADLLQLMGRH